MAQTWQIVDAACSAAQLCSPMKYVYGVLISIGLIVVTAMVRAWAVAV
jgi:hypothetical protein